MGSVVVALFSPLQVVSRKNSCCPTAQTTARKHDQSNKSLLPSLLVVLQQLLVGIFLIGTHQHAVVATNCSEAVIVQHVSSPHFRELTALVTYEAHILIICHSRARPLSPRRALLALGLPGRD